MRSQDLKELHLIQVQMSKKFHVCNINLIQDPRTVVHNTDDNDDAIIIKSMNTITMRK
jgi:hypothetical protein